MGFGESGGIYRVDGRRLDRTGPPNSRVDRYHRGILAQSRWYGSRGQAVRNRDFTHSHHGHGSPHDHTWIDGDGQ